MNHKVGQKGEVVIPKDLRDRHGLLPGVEVTFKDTGESIEIERASRDDR